MTKNNERHSLTGARSSLRLAAGCFLAALLPALAGASTQAVRFCAGDSGCPCGNDSAPGAEEGCLNSTNSGTLLSAVGNAWILDDTLVLRVEQGLPNQNGIFLQNTVSATPRPFFDGVLCLPIDSHLVRHYDPPMILPTTTDSNGIGYNAQPMTLGDFLGDTLPGVSIYYQFWYRDYPGYGTGCTAGANFSSGLRVRWSLGGPEMVRIPAGSFQMGDHFGVGDADELPVHLVTLDAFFMDRFELTNQEYCDFLNSAYGQGQVAVLSNGIVVPNWTTSFAYLHTSTQDPMSRIHWNGSTFTVTASKEDHPVLLVSWYGAVAYANWRSSQDGLGPCYDLSTWACDFAATGHRLPTEAEWEYAARGGEHAPYYLRPWGDTADGWNANYDGSGDPWDLGPDPETTPVGYYSGNQIPAGGDMANGYGLYDTAGNVHEWCNDSYDVDYYGVSPTVNPQGPPSTLTTFRVLRGGAFTDTPGLRSAGRLHAWPYSFGYNRGFRLVRRATP